MKIICIGQGMLVTKAWQPNQTNENFWFGNFGCNFLNYPK